MKECKNSDILPCYRDGYGVWHYSDDTHDKVYELNKQMCDIGKTMHDPFEPLSEEAIQDITKALEITRKPKGIIMEEKMTKKMTKAEAFEYLKGRRVVCDGLNNEDVQRKLFEVGIRWRGGKADVTAAAPFLFINPDGITHCGSLAWFNLHEYEEISADDILSIEIVEEKNGDKRKSEILEEIAKLGEKISDLIEEYGGNVIVEIDQYEVILRDYGDILCRK